MERMDNRGFVLFIYLWVAKCLSYTIFEGSEEQCKEQASYCFPQSAFVSVMVNLQELRLDVTVPYSCCLHFKGEAHCIKALISLKIVQIGFLIVAV